MAELTKEQLAAIDNYSNDIQTLNDEIVIIHRLVDEIYGYISSENIRINYYFS